MIPVLNLLQDIDDKLNKNSSLQGQFIPNEIKILVLNRTQQKLLLKKVGLNNNYQLGLDSFKKRYEDLKMFITPYEKLAVVKNTDVFHSYSSDLTSLAYQFLLPVDSYVLATKNNCKNRILDIISVVKHGDLQTKLKSPHSTPNFVYQESLATISENTFYTYSDKDDTFIINDLYISYLRYPKEVDVPGYTHLDGSASTLQNCEFESYLENELIDLAVEELAKITGNTELMQNTIQSNKENE